MYKTRLLFFLLILSSVFSAKANPDSLWNVWQNESLADTTRLNALNDFALKSYLYKQPDSTYFYAQIHFDFAEARGLKKQMAIALNTQGKSLYEKGNYEDAIDYFKKSITISEMIDYKKGKALSLQILGRTYDILGDYDLALENLEKSLNLNKEIGDTQEVANTLVDIGYVYYYQGDFVKGKEYIKQGLEYYKDIGYLKGIADSWLSLGNVNHRQGNYIQALEEYQKSLLYYEKIENKYGIGNALNNIGNIYDAQGDHKSSLHHYKKALAIAIEMGEKVSIAIPLNNIGSSYSALQEYDSALVYYEQSLAIRQETGNKRGIAASFRSIGALYKAKAEYNTALDYYRKSYKLSDEIGDKNGAAASITSIGLIYNQQKVYEKGISECIKGHELYAEIRSIEGEAYACGCLYEGYKALGNGNKALKYFERLQVLDDSMRSEDIAIKLQQMEFNNELLSDSIARAEEKHLLEAAHKQEMRSEEKRRNISLGVVAFVLLLAIALYSRLRYIRKSKAIIEKERDRSEKLLLNILPTEIANELKENGKAAARDFKMVSILFTDFKGFTEASAQLSAQELVKEINICFEAFDNIITKYGIEKIKTIGDAYMAAGGLPVPTEESLKNTILAALEMQSFIKKRKLALDKLGQPAFEMRCGIHTGPVVAGIVGVKKFQYDIWGDTVNTASRMESSGETGEVNIGKTSYDLLKDDKDFAFEGRGKIKVKGKGSLEMWFVNRADV